MEENRETKNEKEEFTEEPFSLKAAVPDYDSLKLTMRRVMICVVLLIVGIVLLAASKGDISFIIVGILFIAVAAFLFGIAKKGLDRYKKENSEWQKQREKEKENPD